MGWSGGAEIDGALWPMLQAGLLLATLLILLLQPGFTLFVVGVGSRKNAINTIYRTFLGIGVGLLAYLIVGRSIQHGQGLPIDLLTALGLANPAEPELSNFENPSDGLLPIIDAGLALAAHAIALSITAGRITILGSALYSALFAALIYPLVAFTMWNPAGLYFGALDDFAGSAAVHLCGGASALAAALVLGPRLGYNGHDPINIGHERLFRITASHLTHHAPMAAQGIFLIWAGFVGVAAAATLGGISSGSVPLVSTDLVGQISEVQTKLSGVTLNLLLAPVGALIAVALIQGALRRNLDFLELLVSVPAGLAAIAAGIDGAPPVVAVAVGAVGGVAAIFMKNLLSAMSIDDPIATISTHVGAALVGLTLVGLAGPLDGVLSRVGIQFGYALALFSAILLVALAGLLVVEGICKAAAIATRRRTMPDAMRRTTMRVDYEAEISGLDETKHGQDAYNFRALR